MDSNVVIQFLDSVILLVKKSWQKLFESKPSFGSKLFCAQILWTKMFFDTKFDPKTSEPKFVEPEIVLTELLFGFKSFLGFFFNPIVLPVHFL